MLLAIDQLHTAEYMLLVRSLHTTTCAATRAYVDPGDRHILGTLVLHGLDLFSFLRWVSLETRISVHVRGYRLASYGCS